MTRKLASLLASIGIVAISAVSAHASPACVKGEKPYALAGDTMVWTIHAGPGFECIQGLRWSYMQISSVSIAKAPTKGKVVIVGYGFRYFAASKDTDGDSFTLVVEGKNKRDPGKSILQILVKPAATMISELSPRP